jgi:hypothetical protein
VKGGCACGAVRYRLANPPRDAGWCHCRTCQLNSGSPAMAFATVDAADFIFEQGDVASFKSSETGRRSFCRACGTPLFMQDEGGDTLDFSLPTLDESGAATPGFHMYYASRIPWAGAADDLPRFARSRREG